jgi:hypothetical protein
MGGGTLELRRRGWRRVSKLLAASFWLKQKPFFLSRLTASREMFSDGAGSSGAFFGIKFRRGRDVSTPL